MTMKNAEPRIRMWLNWDVPRDQLLRGFAAAASYYRALPWQGIKESEPIRAILPGGSRWTLFIVGPAKECGMLAFREYEDGRKPPADDVVGEQTPSISLSFGTNEKMPEELLQEIRETGCDVAAPVAYPRYYAFGAVTFDLTLGELDEVITLVEAVPRYVKARQRLLAAEGVLARRQNVLTQLSWTDESSGVQFEDAKRGE